MYRVGVVIPTLNAGPDFQDLLEQIGQQDCPLVRRLVIDSGSEDTTPSQARQYGFEVLSIERRQFNHGGTRQMAFERMKNDVDLVFFITQDIRLYDKDSFSHLVEAFGNPEIGAAYGRQLPFPGASVSASLLRQFNYPAESCVKSLEDRKSLGIKTAFLSDSFAAYRCDALAAVGGFPQKVVVCEDMYVAAKLLLAGYKIAYAAEARVYHSHEYGWKENFWRYYLTGVFHKQEAWIADTFGASEKEGLWLLRYQLQKAYEAGGWQSIGAMLLDDVVKYAAFRWGKIRG